MTYERELDRTVERLRQLSDARLVPHQQEFAALLARLTDRRVPQVQPRAWGDQLLVIGRDVPAGLQETAGTALVDFRRSLDLQPGA